MRNECEKEYKTTAPGRQELLKKDNGWIDQQAEKVEELSARCYHLNGRLGRLIVRLTGETERPETASEECAKSSHAFGRFSDSIANLNDQLSRLEGTVGMLEDINLA